MQPTQPQNKLTEIAVLVIVALLIVAGAFLLYVGKVDFTGMLTLFGFAGGVLGVQGAFKAPSPTQSAQLQTLFSQVMSVLPGIVQQLQPPAVTIHNNIPASPTPTPLVQPAVAPLAPVTGTNAQTWNQPVTPIPQNVPQQQFPAQLQPPSWTQQTQAVTP